jgi:hypothetical protein
MSESDSPFKLSIPDVYSVVQALEISIRRKVFSEEEIKDIYGPWSRVMRFCDDVRRKTEIEKIYAPEPKVEETLETLTIEEEK